MKIKEWKRNPAFTITGTYSSLCWSGSSVTSCFLLYLRFNALSRPADISRLPSLREHWKPSSHSQAQQGPLSHPQLPMHGTGPTTSVLRTAPCSGLFKYVNCCLYTYFLTVVPIHLHISHCFRSSWQVLSSISVVLPHESLLQKKMRKILNVVITTRQKSKKKYFRQICCWSF